jgi:hypothetical protein
MKHSVIKWLLLLGTVYFAATGLFHSIGLKIPMFYIYYNIPSYEYQDKLIAMLAFGWAAFFFIASQAPGKFYLIIRTVIIVGAIALGSLLWINFTTDFHQLNPRANANMYSLEVIPLFIYWVALMIFAIRHEKRFFNID